VTLRIYITAVLHRHPDLHIRDRLLTAINTNNAALAGRFA
jgi:hypothetical protein